MHFVGALFALLCGKPFALDPESSFPVGRDLDEVYFVQEKAVHSVMMQGNASSELPDSAVAGEQKPWEVFRYAAIGSVAIGVLGFAMNPLAPAVLVVAGWAGASISMSLLNKQATTVFPLAALLISLQMGITDVTLVAAERKTMTCGKRSDLLKWCVVPFF